MGKPAKTWRVKGIDIAAWRDDAGRHSFTLRKQYLKKDTQIWVDTKYLYPDDLKALHQLLQDVIEWNSAFAGNKAEHENAFAASAAEVMEAKLAARQSTKFDDDDIPF